MTATDEARPRRARNDTRRKLVDAATDLMWKHGISEVSVDMILERAQVLKGSFYHFFPSKADILLECLDNVWRRQSDQLAAIYAAAATPREALERHLHTLVRAQIDAKSELGFVPGTFNMSMPTSMLREDARIAGKLRELMDCNLDYLERGLRLIAETQGLRHPVETTARLLAYAVSGATLVARMNNSRNPLQDFNLILADALAARPGAASRPQAVIE
jgi:TetR/AcrR family transcriptional repressor of nem operon